MFAAAADDLQELTSVQLQAFQSLLAIDTLQRTPPMTTSPTKSKPERWLLLRVEHGQFSGAIAKLTSATKSF
jgi:hypothetical protein